MDIKEFETAAHSFSQKTGINLILISGSTCV